MLKVDADLKINRQLRGAATNHDYTQPLVTD